MILGLFLITFLGGCSSKAKLQQLPTTEDMQLHIDLQNGKYDIDLDSEEKKDKKAVLRNNEQDDSEYADCSDDVSEECDECDCDTCATSSKDSCCEQTCDNCNAPKESVMYVPYPYPVFVPNNIGWLNFSLTISPDENSTEATTALPSHSCPEGIARCTARNYRSLSLREQKNIENYAINDKIPDNEYRREKYRPVDEDFHPDSGVELLPTRRVDQSVFSRKRKEQELQSDFDLEEAKRQIEILQREYAKLDQNESHQQKTTSYRDGSYQTRDREVPYRRKELDEYYQYVPKHPQNYKDDPNYPIRYQDVPTRQRYQEQSTYEDIPYRKKSNQQQNSYEDVPNHEKSFQAQSPYQDVANPRKIYQDQSTDQDVADHRKYQDQRTYQDVSNHQKNYQDKSNYQDGPNHQTPYQGQQSVYEDVPNHQKAYQDKHPYRDVPNHPKSYQDQRPHQECPSSHFSQDSDSDHRRYATTNKNGVCSEQHPHNVPDHKKQDVHNQPQYKYEATQDQPYQSVNELLKALTGRRKK